MIRSVLDERLLGSDVIVEVRKKVGMNVLRSTAGDLNRFSLLNYKRKIPESREVRCSRMLEARWWGQVIEVIGGIVFSKLTNRL